MKDLLRKMAFAKIKHLDGRTLTDVLTRYCSSSTYGGHRLYLFGNHINSDSDYIYLAVPGGEICFAHPPNFYFHILRHAVDRRHTPPLGLDSFVREMCQMILKESK